MERGVHILEDKKKIVRISGSFCGQKFEIFLVSYYSITKAGFVFVVVSTAAMEKVLYHQRRVWGALV